MIILMIMIMITSLSEVITMVHNDFDAGDV